MNGPIVRVFGVVRVREGNGGQNWTVQLPYQSTARNLDQQILSRVTIHAFAHPGFAGLGNQSRAEILRDEIVEIVIRPQNDVATAPAIAATGTAFRHVGLAVERDAAASAVPGTRKDFDFINEHRAQGCVAVSGKTNSSYPDGYHNKKQNGEASRPRREMSLASDLVCRWDRFGNDIDPAAVFVKLHPAIDQGEKGPVPARADIEAGVEFRPALADENAARGDQLTAEFFYSQSFADAVAPVANAALTFLVCHKTRL